MGYKHRFRLANVNWFSISSPCFVRSSSIGVDGCVSGGRAGWCGGFRGERSVTEAGLSAEGEGLRAALQHPGACDGQKLAHRSGHGLCSQHHRLSDSHGFPADHVHDGLSEDPIQTRPIQSKHQPVWPGCGVYQSSAAGERRFNIRLSSVIPGEIQLTLVYDMSIILHLHLCI